MDRLAQLFIIVSKLDTMESHLWERFIERLKFVGVLIIVSIGLVVGSFERRGRR